AACDIEVGVPNKLIHKFSQTGFSDLSLELADHNRRGAEHSIVSSTSGACLIALYLAVPAFEFEAGLCGIVIVKLDHRRQEKHGGSDDKPLPGCFSRMRVDHFIKGDPGGHSFIAERSSVPSKRDKGRKQARLLHAVQDA